MEYNELDNILNNIDKSLDKQINLITLQLAELKNQINSIETLLQKLRSNNSK
ncbi:MAG: hypothetical protein AB7V50_04945 [Vampirovibrionia bacterium]